MNNKNKVLLTSVGLALLSGIAATSSTFAWFTTTRTASISYSNATVTSAQSNLAIAYKSSKSTVTNSLAGSVLTLSGANLITDISGDGINFFKPVWSATSGIASSINAVDYSTSADGKLVDFTVTLTVSGQTAMNVYMGSGSGINPVGVADAEDLAAVASSRMAVLSGATPLFFYAPNAAGEKHLTAASATPVDVYANDAGVVDATVAAAALTTLSTFTTLTANPATPGAAHAFVGKLTPTETAPGSGVWTPATLDVTFRVWIEGQDIDAINAAIGGVFNIAVSLYALEA